MMEFSNLDAFYTKSVEVSFGRSANEMSFVNSKEGKTLYELLTENFTFRVGPKDGRCIVGSHTTTGRRTAQHMSGPTILMIDHDTGETMDEIAAKYEAAGLYALLWNTFSHLKAQSDVTEKALSQYLKKAPKWKSQGQTAPDLIDEEVLTEQIRDYFVEEKGYIASLAETMHSPVRTTSDGVRYVISHDPMHKLRSLLVLEEKFDLLNSGVQDERITEWKERYAGFCQRFNVPYDNKCVDPCRLMYLPGRPKGSDESNYEIREVEGRYVTLDDMPRFNKRTGKVEVNAFTAAARELRASIGDDDKDTRKFETRNLRKFMAQGGSSFAIAEWLREVAQDDVRAERDLKLTLCCPNDDNHTNAGDPNDQGFWVQNAQDRDEGAGFMAMCSHTTCGSMSNNDRAWYLDALCQKYGIEDALDLKDWCDDWKESNDEIREAEASENERAWKAGLSALPEAPSPDDLLVLVRIIAAGPNGLYEDARLDAIVEKVGKSRARRATLVKEVAKARERITAEASNNSSRPAVAVVVNPVPDNPDKATVIFASWDYYDKIKCARARFCAVNNKEPAVFRRTEGGIVRLQNVGDTMLFEPVNTRYQWVHELAKRMKFVIDTEGDEADAEEPFVQVLNEFMGANDLPLPVVERIVEVPVFGEDGTLRTEKGYDASSKTYLNPSIQFIEVPEIIDEKHVNTAKALFLEATRDFPFSDSFTGRDDKPVRLRTPDGGYADCDDDGHPWPNFERGMASRANFYAMVLQPFARSMIAGPCPAYLIDKSMPGTGAGFLADVAGMILSGARMVPQTIPGDGDEFRKEMASVLREGATTVFFDNMTTKIDSGALASALTAGVWKSRILGQSATVSIPIKATWIFAANNGRFSDELMRRIVPIRMDAATSNPARDRGGDWYKHADLHAWLEENRASLVWACHVLIKNWVQQGRPEPSSGITLQSFNSWAHTMGGILEAAGLPGFLDNVGAYLEGREEDAATETPLIARVWAHAQSEWLRVDELIDACKNRITGDLEPGLGVDLDTRNDSAMQRSMGAAMGRVVGKVYRIETLPGMSQLVQVEKKVSNGARYRVVLVE